MASIAITTAVIAIVGAGVSAYGQYTQGKSQNAIAQFNALNQEKQAKANLLSMQTQAALQKQEAETNFKLRQAEANARNNNADAIEKQVVQQDGVNRINLEKRREEYRRTQSAQRASLAASGAAESVGTPLDILAETAAKIQTDLEEQNYASEIQRWALLGEAGRERFGGKLALAGATLDKYSGLAAAALGDASAKSGFFADIRGAELTRLTGKAAQKAANYQAAGTLLSGVGSAVGALSGGGKKPSGEKPSGEKPSGKK